MGILNSTRYSLLTIAAPSRDAQLGPGDLRMDIAPKAAVGADYQHVLAMQVLIR